MISGTFSEIFMSNKKANDRSRYVDELLTQYLSHVLRGFLNL